DVGLLARVERDGVVAAVEARRDGPPPGVGVDDDLEGDDLGEDEQKGRHDGRLGCGWAGTTLKDAPAVEVPARRPGATATGLLCIRRPAIYPLRGTPPVQGENRVLPPLSRGGVPEGRRGRTADYCIVQK